MVNDVDDAPDDEAEYDPRSCAHTAFVGDMGLEFYLRIDPSGVIRPIYEAQGDRFDDRAATLEYVSRLRSALTPIAAESNLTVEPEPWRGPKTGGPIPDQTYTVYLLGVAFDGVTTIVTLAAFAELLRRAMAKVKSMTNTDVAISNGAAVMLAADAVVEKTGEQDLTLAFVTPMNRYLPDVVGEMESPSDGWLVGFRSRGRLFVARVDSFGDVTVADGDVRVTWTTA